MKRCRSKLSRLTNTSKVIKSWKITKLDKNQAKRLKIGVNWQQLIITPQVTSVEREARDYPAEIIMEKKTNKSKASKPAGRGRSLDPPPTKKAKPDVDLNLRIANAFKSIIVETRNEEFREKCLQILGVTNGSEAGEKIEELLAKFKDSNEAK